jgi:uncharacterized protein (DUF1330 family)
MGGIHSLRWKGGYVSDGYRRIYVPSHPAANKRGYVKEHRWLMEQHLGRYLTKDEHVHHINGDRTDNRIENLQLISSSKHTSFHNKGNNYAKANIIDMSNRKCCYCEGTETYTRHWFRVGSDFCCSYCNDKLRKRRGSKN